MSRIDDLLEKYEDKLVFTERKKQGFESINELVDIIEEPIGKLSRPHLNSIIGKSIYSKEPINTDSLNVKLYKVVENDKSAVYYDHLTEMNKAKFPDPVYFWDQAIYIVVKDSRSIIALDNSLLSYDYQVNQGITDKDYRDKSDNLLLYLEVFDMYLGQ